MKLLLCTNGSTGSKLALIYGRQLAAALEAEVFILGIYEDDRTNVVERHLKACADWFEERNISFNVHRETGRTEQILARGIASAEQALIVIGRLDRSSLTRLMRGRSIRRLLPEVSQPLLYITEESYSQKHMLLCMGGLGFAANMVTTAQEIALQTGARITLLHVIEPATFDYPISEALHSDSIPLLETNTPQAQHLKQTLETLQAAQLNARLVVREGFVRTQILSEIQEGDYDMVGVGSHYATDSLRPLFTPNITSEIAEAAGIPVLIVR